MTNPPPSPVVGHTAGERWVMAAAPSSIVGWPIVSSPEGQSICNLSWLGKKPDHVSDEDYAAYRAKVVARGRLIAAAPALLEALKRIEKNARQLAEDKSQSDTSRRTWKLCEDEARAAINQATGRDLEGGGR